MSLHQIDAVLQSAVPTVMVGRMSALAPLETNGHRFLAGADGLWLEARREWIHAVVPLVRQTVVPMPYGTVQQSLEIVPIPRSLLREFQSAAQANLPNECAGHIVRNSKTGTFRLVLLQAVSASRDHVDVVIDAPLEHEEVVLDVHSHAYFKAFFSPTDDKDDKGVMKLAAVISFEQIADTPGATRCKAIFRLCLNGLYLPLHVDADDEFFYFNLEKSNGTHITS